MKGVANKILNIRFIPNGDQVAYGFTKSIWVIRVEAFRYGLNQDKLSHFVRIVVTC
jgi:hypothetical protein